MEQVKRFRVPVIAGVAVLIVALIVLEAWIAPEGRKASTLNQQKTTLMAQQASLQAQLTSLQTEQRNVKANCAELSKDLTEIPTSPASSLFLKQVTQLAQASGDPNTPSYTLATASKAPSGVSAITVNLSLSGTYGQMVQFLQGLGSFQRLFTISTLTISGGPVITGNQLAPATSPGYSVTLTGDIYYAPAPPANICAPSSTVP